MTQNPGPYQTPYPSPYQYPPGYGYDPAQVALAPARRAGVMMIVLGSLMLLLGLCGGIGLFVDDQMMLEQMQKLGVDLGENPTATLEQYRLESMISSIRVLVLGLPMLILGISVRSGRSGPVMGGIIVTVLALVLIVGADVVIALMQSRQNPVALVGLCTAVIPLVLFSLQLVWLIQARRAGATIQAMQYQHQYWQYAQQQQQQAYGQAGYLNPTYPSPTTNPPPPAAPPQGEGNEPPATS